MKSSVWIRKLLTELNFALGPNINMRNVSTVSDEIDPSYAGYTCLYATNT